MDSLTPPTPIHYTARISNVREVTLWGTADLSFWQAFLHPSGLRPYAVSGTAQVVLSASALVWKGFAFRELTVSLATCLDREQPRLDSFYLIQAFSSSRILAWAERHLFTTPYAHADVSLNPARPQLSVRQHQRPLLQAQMAHPAQPTWREDTWHGAVFLPPHGAGEPLGRNYMWVALSGEQAIYPFTGEADVVEIAAHSDFPTFHWLTESHFMPTEWRIRTGATHARSKTYRHDGGLSARS